ncbi:MAG: hypothetical protein PWQ70_2948 [Clostridiales bacterium]|nr:hypothetical protein [Clostridiales bacterium]
MGYSITVVSDIDSWINIFIPVMIKKMYKYGEVKWVHDVSEITGGDFVFYLSCGQIVPKAILIKNKHNLVVHGSDLPKGRGWSPLTWQILEGKNEIPITLFEAAEQVDTGVIYLQEFMSLEGNELIDEIREKLYECTERLCLRFIEQYPAILEKSRIQEGEPTYYRRRKPEDSKLDPDKTIREQFNLLRVVDNERYPAFFELYGCKYVIKIFKENG